MNKFFSSSPVWQNTGLALVRVILGLFLVYHGWEVFNAGKMNEYLAWDIFKTSASSAFMIYTGKVAELVGGVLLSVGLLTRVSAIMIIGTMGYIAFFVGSGKIWYQDQHPFLFVLLATIFFFTGPGKWSLDYLFFGGNKYSV